MKKIILILVLIFLSNSCSYAKESSRYNFKNLIKNPFKQEKIIQPQENQNEEFTKSKQAILLYNENNLKNAFEILLSMKESERSSQDWILLGNILQDQNKTSDAVFMYQRAILVDPKSYKAYYNLGNIYLEEEKPYLAIENYRKANKANNQFAYAYYNLGCAYLRIGNLKKAKIAFLKAIELKNTEPDFHYNVAYTYKMLNKTKTAKQYLGFYNKLMENN
jgi:tetratricopeptide (TPR) repeat protein